MSIYNTLEEAASAMMDARGEEDLGKAVVTTCGALEDMAEQFGPRAVSAVYIITVILKDLTRVT